MKTLWLQDIVRDRGLQIKSVSSKANSADLWTKAPPVVRLNALRAACGIVVPGEPACEPVDEWGTDGLTTSGWRLSDELSGALGQVVRHTTLMLRWPATA